MNARSEESSQVVESNEQSGDSRAQATGWLSDKGRTVDAWAFASEEGRGRRRKATGSRQTGPDPWMSEWGNPACRNAGHHLAEYIGLVKRTRRTETSKYPEEETSIEIP